MSIRCFLTIISLILLTSKESLADNFEDYVQRLSKHPQIEAILAESESSKMKAQGELGLPDPDITVGASGFPMTSTGVDRLVPRSKFISFSQGIPNSFKRTAKSDELNQLSSKQKLIATYAKERLRFILISKMAEYQSIQTQKLLINKQLEYYQELDDTFKGQIESGKSVYVRFAEVDVNRADSERELNDIEARFISVRADFIQLIDEIPVIAIPAITDKTWNNNKNSLYPVMIASQDILISKKGVRVANTSFYPDFSVGAAYNKSNDNNGSIAVRAELSIPLWASQNQEPKLKAAKAKEASAKFAYNEIGRSWIQQVTSIQSMRDAAAKNIKVLENQDKSMKSKIDAVQRNYEAGLENLDSLLLAKIDRLNIQIQLAQVNAIHISKAAEFNSNIAKDYKETQK